MNAKNGFIVSRSLDAPNAKRWIRRAGRLQNLFQRRIHTIIPCIKRKQESGQTNSRTIWSSRWLASVAKKVSLGTH